MVQHWLETDYPAIVAQARREKGVIYWGDETGLRGDDVRGRSYAPRGRTPVVRPSQKRASVGLISAVTNKGELRWGDGFAVLSSGGSPSAMVLEAGLKGPMLIHFLERLIREAERKVFLILDNLPVHHSRAVRAWLAERRTQIEVFYLPAYSPELNPDEGLHADLKQAVTGKPPARSRPELKRRVINHMRRLSKLPSRVRSFFRRPTARYAA